MTSTTARKSVLIVEDEADLANAVAYHLEREGYACRRAPDGSTALAEIQRHPPDVIVLDRMLPKLSGDEVATRLRADSRTARIPILMLTAKAEESDELVGFALGVDDYVTKPFSTRLLAARIAALLRRQDVLERETDVLRIGPIVVDRSRHEITVDGAPVQFTVTEFRILATLIAARGRVMSRDHLIDAVRGSGVAVTNRTIDVHVAALRKKLGAAAAWIQTVRGVGYTVRAPSADEPAG